MYYKCELLVGGYVYPVTEYIRNWDDITVSFKRNDYDGVARTFTDKFEFVKGARVMLMDEYRSNYLRAAANIVISTRNNSWTWTERFRCALDFSTLSDDGFVLSINAVDDSVASLIKAKKGTQYEYVVSEMSDDNVLLYDRLHMNSNINWVDGVSYDENLELKVLSLPSGSSMYAMAFPVYVSESEIANTGKVEVNDVSDFEPRETRAMTPFIKALEDITIHLDIQLYLSARGLPSNVYPSVHLRKYSSTGVVDILRAAASLPTDTTVSYKYSSNVVMKRGDYILFLIENPYGDPFSIIVGDSVTFNVSFVSKGNDVNIPLIKPSKLLNRLLKSMNGGVDELTGVIVHSGEKRLDNAMILAAESARQMPGAKLYSSFKKFCEWMSAVFGYVYDINGKVITFRPRKDYFGDDVVKTITDYSDYTMNVNSSLIYSQVNVGYNKQDYDSVNGKDEFRFTNIYNTGITLTDNKLELISPYRADAYGIEFLAQKAGEDTTDNSSDTDVFFVCAVKDGDRYVLDRTDSISGVISPSTMFNVMYSPTSMIEANKDYIGGYISKLDYASSEGNTSVTINGKAENRDITIEGGIFVVDEVEIETSDIELPEDMTGIVEFQHQGMTVSGYYKSTDFHYTKSKSAKVTLIIKK